MKSNLQHALNILQDIIDKQNRGQGPIGQLTLVKSYILSEIEKDSAIKYAQEFVSTKSGFQSEPKE